MCHGSNSDALSETIKLSGVSSTPFDFTSAISLVNASISTATPLPRMFITPSLKIPEGNKCRANLPLSFTIVCPALPPP